MEMSKNPTSTWWSRQSLGAKIFWAFIVLVVLAILLASPTYWNWVWN
jgi:hypothetical protein